MTIDDCALVSRRRWGKGFYEEITVFDFIKYAAGIVCRCGRKVGRTDSKAYNRVRARGGRRNG